MLAVLEPKMSQPKRGRPAKDKTEATTRIDAELARKLKVLAGLQSPKLTIGEYLTKVAGPAIQAEWDKFVDGERASKAKRKS